MSEFGRRRGTFVAPPGPRSTVRRRRRRVRRRPRTRRRKANPRTGGFLGVELKFYDQTLVNNALATNTDGSGIEEDPSATLLLNTVTQGDGESQRDGRRMTMKSIFVSGVVSTPGVADQTAPEEQTHIAIWLVLDKQTNGATITSENVFVNKSGGAFGGTSLMRNLQFTSRYRILDKVEFTLPTPAISGDSTNFDLFGTVTKWSLSANLKNMGVLFSNTTETVANIIDNSLHILATCTSLSMAPAITYNSRLRFVG